ncbi:factor of DNA methylation 4-like [Ricinus communis]|uniref:factor of DNA methylation 4-like n=1 Tax=Ricinus communis TaxID=3988 RepID=UPI00201B2D57|nr:factor of DNA methylation 4-like [Ricinus communis]
MLENEMKEKDEKVRDLEARCTKERKANDQFQEAHKELIRVSKQILENSFRPHTLECMHHVMIYCCNSMCLLIQGFAEFPSSRANIRTKRMGELDSNPFYATAKRKYGEFEAEEKATELISLWEELLKDECWYPFKMLQDKTGELKEVIDETDINLKDLRKEYGERAYESVTRALQEINEYNPNGREPVLELWNFKEDRKAADMKEGVAHLLKLCKIRNAKAKYEARK